MTENNLTVSYFLSYFSNDVNVATVDNNGLITAVNNGNCEITIKSEKYGEQYCYVTVETLLKSINIQTPTDNSYFNNGVNVSYFKVGQTYYFTTIPNPSNSSYPEVLWNSSNNNVVSIDNIGKVTAKAVGTAIITATSKKYPSIVDTTNVQVIADTSNNEPV